MIFEKKTDPKKKKENSTISIQDRWFLIFREFFFVWLLYIVWGEEAEGSALCNLLCHSSSFPRGSRTRMNRVRI